MRRYRYIVLGAAISCFGVGCGEDQPNAAAVPEQADADFAKKSVDMMKAANTGMNKKGAKPAPKPAD